MWNDTPATHAWKHVSRVTCLKNAWHARDTCAGNHICNTCVSCMYHIGDFQHMCYMHGIFTLVEPIILKKTWIFFLKLFLMQPLYDNKLLGQKMWLNNLNFFVLFFVLHLKLFLHSRCRRDTSFDEPLQFFLFNQVYCVLQQYLSV